MTGDGGSGDAFDPYKVLQVDPEAEPEVIEAAFRRLARKYHPDVTADPQAPARMIALNRAWAELRDPDRRAAGDRERARRPGRPGQGRAPERTAEATPASAAPNPETFSRDWTPGRSTAGGGYDPSTMRAAEGTGAAGQPPGHPSGPVLGFGRYAGWSLGEIGRTDVEYLEWLERMPIGRAYRVELDQLLRRAGRRSDAAEAVDRRGLFRRR